MLFKVPYELVIGQADHWIEMAASSTYHSWLYMDRYERFLLACGWTDKELDCETLRRVDMGWTR
jgi:hypothetical protein